MARLKLNGQTVCSITLPGSWNGGYVLAENSGSLGVFDKASYVTNTGYDGCLFTLRLFFTNEYVNFPGHELLNTLKINNTVYYLVLLRPTDIQYVWTDPALVQSYLNKQADIDRIIAGMKYTGLAQEYKKPGQK